MQHIQSLSSPDKETIFIGVNHNSTFKLPQSVVGVVVDCGKRNGFWYEGNGGDKEKIEKQIQQVKWSGSWDNFVKSGSSDFYYTLFSNSKSGTDKIINSIKDNNKTILSALVSAGDLITHEALKGNSSQSKLKTFLSDCGGGLLHDAEVKHASVVALRSFIRKGESMMWPSNWRDNETSASKIAIRANNIRLHAILNRHGVFFLGKDHLQTLKMMRKDLKPLTVLT